MLKVVLILTVASHVCGYPMFLDLIPNGDKVPNPCPSGSATWHGVGHFALNGGGPLNIFGKHFYFSYNVWDEALCNWDSDFDGISNGVELGDPDCIWTPGQPVPGNATGHPGICEPIGSEKCANKNVGLNCPK